MIAGHLLPVCSIQPLGGRLQFTVKHPHIFCFLVNFDTGIMPGSLSASFLRPTLQYDACVLVLPDTSVEAI